LNMYSVGVKIEGIENRRRSAGLLHIVIGLFLIIKGAAYYQSINYKNFLPVVPVLLVGSFSLFYGFFRRRIDFTYRYNYWLRLLQLICFTFLGIMIVGIGRPMDYIGSFVFSFLCILLLFTERRIFQETTIYLNEKGITIPGYYKDHLVLWQDLSEVVVREDFITFFHVKKKYLQYQVMQDLSTLEVAKMNAFSKEQIEKQSQTTAAGV
jgi:hypothetical protein